MLHVLPGCCRLNDFSAHACGESHPGAVNVSAGFSEKIKNFWVVEKVDADFGQQSVCVVLNEREALFVENFDVGDVAFDEGRCCRGRCAPRLTSSGPTPAFSSTRTFVHRATSMVRRWTPRAFVRVASGRLCRSAA